MRNVLAVVAILLAPYALVATTPACNGGPSAAVAPAWTDASDDSDGTDAGEDGPREPPPSCLTETACSSDTQCIALPGTSCNTALPAPRCQKEQCSPAGGACSTNGQCLAGFECVDNFCFDPKAMPEGYAQMPYLSATPIHEFSKPEQVIKPNKSYLALLDTDVGSMVLELYAKDAPVTVNSFVFLALNHFYEGHAFFRVVDGFMAQTGDPNTISGDPSTWGYGDCGYSFGIEVKDSLKFDGAGALGMAHVEGDPNTNGAQFFITFMAAANLDMTYTVWGKVSGGLDVLDKIKRGTESDDFLVRKKPTRIVEVRIGSK